MVYNFKEWQDNSINILGSTFSGIYCTLLVCIYLAFSFTELVKYPDLQDYLERNGFFIYLLVLCNLYFVYIMIWVPWVKK